MPERPMALSYVQPITLSLSKLSFPERMASNDKNGKRKLVEEVESSTARKRLRLSDNNVGDDDSSDMPEDETEEEEEEEEVSSKEMSMNQLDTSKEKLFARSGNSLIFSDDGDMTSPPLEPHTPKSSRRSDEDSSDDDDDDDNF
jgi:hypothetical protein